MEIEEVMESLTSYYGDYESVQVKSQVAAFIIDRIKPTEYKSLCRIIKDWHKVIFKAPCIATIRECIDKAVFKDKKFEPYKVKTTNPQKYNYREEKEQITEQERQDNLKRLSQFKVKKV